jgi:hypothetical protein
MANWRRRTLQTLLIGLLVAFAAAVTVLKLMPEAPVRPMHATVTAIRPADDAYHAMVWVTARTSTGLVGSRVVPLRDLRCRVGDDVDGQLRGTTFSPNERTCRRTS